MSKKEQYKSEIEQASARLAQTGAGAQFDDIATNVSIEACEYILDEKSPASLATKATFLMLGSYKIAKQARDEGNESTYRQGILDLMEPPEMVTRIAWGWQINPRDEALKALFSDPASDRRKMPVEGQAAEIFADENHIAYNRAHGLSRRMYDNSMAGYEMALAVYRQNNMTAEAKRVEGKHGIIEPCVIPALTY